MSKIAVMAFSGGMDSTGLLVHLLANDYEVHTLSYDYGQKHKLELDRAKANIAYLSENNIKVTQRIVDLQSAMSIFHSALTTEDYEVPEGHYEEENMVATVVPNRNKIFSSITQAVALSVANKTEEPCDIALGIHAGDHAIYPDCRQEFRDADYEAFQIGNWNAETVGFFIPYIDTDKLGILKDGQKLTKELELDFDQVYARTNTSYKPYPSGNSDYKSASSVERIEAFIALGVDDPVQYEDETGPVSYQVAKAHVEKLLAEYA